MPKEGGEGATKNHASSFNKLGEQKQKKTEEEKKIIRTNNIGATSPKKVEKIFKNMLTTFSSGCYNGDVERHNDFNAIKNKIYTL